MPENQRATTVPDASSGTKYVVGCGVQVQEPADTTSAAQHMRTVATSLTTGNVSIRYAPRTPPGAGADTTS